MRPENLTAMVEEVKITGDAKGRKGRKKTKTVIRSGFQPEFNEFSSPVTNETISDSKVPEFGQGGEGRVETC